MNKSIFLDRDGVLNPLVYNLSTGEYESPHHLEDFSLFPYVGQAIKMLQRGNYKLFLITNQPSYAKGKTTLENIKAIHQALDDYLRLQGIHFTEYYYCYHHPAGIVPEYTTICECRKPGNRFLKDAQHKHDLDFNASWLIGDQDSDIECGQSLGLKTIQIINKHSLKKRGKTHPTCKANNLQEAVEFILTKKETHNET
jgi:D-glycero-D-manno-heptose 1,7-bisphosphate phosphatase